MPRLISLLTPAIHLNLKKDLTLSLSTASNQLICIVVVDA